MSNAREFRSFRSVGAVVALVSGLLACSGSDLGGGFLPGASTTTISGKVTLPSALANKPGYKAEMYARLPSGKPGTQSYKPASKPIAGEAAGALPAQAATLVEAPVELYDAAHPEWIYPIAVAQTDASGNYKLTALTNAVENGNAYVNGAPIPSGYYTLLSKKTDPVTKELQVAIQTVVKGFSGAITGTNLVAQPSDALPRILSIQGVRKNTDGTETWGKQSSPTTPGAPQIANTSAIQVVFSMAMYRQSVLNDGLSLSCANGNVDGKWTITADWTTATFYPASPLPAGDCTLTVKGSDTSGTPVRNVYENAQIKTAYGYFTVMSAPDTVKPTGIILSPEANDASLTSPVRFASNELLDINAITVLSDPSFGDRPRVVYLGKSENDNSQYQYLYDVVPSRAMKLDTNYTIVVAGAKDLSGNEMSVLNYSFGTADSAPGVSSTDAAVQEVQLEALTTFGKWLRSFNEQNIGTMQSLMSGDFIYEYPKEITQFNNNNYETVPYLKEDDINRDGRLSLREFSSMLENAYRRWEYCKTTMSGSVIDVINVDLVSGRADFAFTLSSASVLTNQDCRDEGAFKLYLTLEQQNSAWVIVRASEGIDTRNTPAVTLDYIPLLTPADDTVLSTATSESNPVRFSWDDSISMVEGQAAKTISSYVFAIWDAHNREYGKAYMIDPAEIDTLDGLNGIFAFNFFSTAAPPTGVTDISTMFGFSAYDWNWYTGSSWDITGSGQELEWVVLGLGTVEPSMIASIDSGDLRNDIVASSKPAHYQNFGVRPQITADVLANGVPLIFSEFIWGYDAGSNSNVTLQLTSTNANPSWSVYVEGKSGYKSYSSTGGTDGTVDGNGTVQISLYQGLNNIYVYDGQGLFRWFTIATMGGEAPKILIYTVMTDNGSYISPDAWGFVSAVGTKKVTIIGKVTDSSKYVYQYLYNNNFGAWKQRKIEVSSTGIFMTDVYVDPYDPNKQFYPDPSYTYVTRDEQLDIYKGDNFIDIQSEKGNYNRIDIYTDTGSAFVPPITIKVGGAMKTEDRGIVTFWDASADSNNNVKISGIMSEALKTTLVDPLPSCYLYSDAGYKNCTNWVYVDPATGEYSFYIDLYHGWNTLSLSDGKGNYSEARIFTSNGKVVVPLQIQSVNDVSPPYNGAQMTVSGCNAVVKGIAEPGSVLNAYWYGYDGTYNSENPTVQVGWVPTVDTNGDGVQDAAEFTMTVPVLSDKGYGAYNYLDIYDDSWRWTGISLTTTSTCGYTAPVNTITQVTGSDGNGIVYPSISGSNLSFLNNDVTNLYFWGSHSRTGHTISATLTDNCGVPHPQSVTTTPGWSLGIPVYKYWNDLIISDGYTSNYYYTYSTTSTDAAPRVGLEMTSPVVTPTYTGSCGYKEYDVGGATTITIQATTYDGLSGAGTLYTSMKTIPLNFVGGVATATVSVYDGYNYVDVVDPANRWASLYVMTSNGVLPPKPMKVTSPLQGGTVSGSVTITGQWDKTWYSPDYLYATVTECDTNWTCEYSRFSNSGTYTPFGSIDTSTGVFTFTATIDGLVSGLPATYTRIYVYGENSENWEGHANSIYVNSNPNGYTEYWYKPSAGGTTEDVTTSRAAKMIEREEVKRMLQERKAARVKPVARMR